MTLYENRQGTVSGTATYDAAAVCGCDAFYSLDGTHDDTGVHLTLFRVSFIPPPSFAGVLVHRDTLRGAFDGGGTWDFIRQ